MEFEEHILSAIAMVDAAYAQLMIKDGTTPDPNHPISRIAYVAHNEGPVHNFDSSYDILRNRTQMNEAEFYHRTFLFA